MGSLLVIVEMDRLFYSSRLETREEREGLFHKVRHNGARSIPMRVKPAIISDAMDTEDILITEAGILHMSGCRGKATLCNDVLRQPLNPIIANVVGFLGQLKSIMLTSPKCARQAIPVGQTG
jgi:hypothetical protein